MAAPSPNDNDKNKGKKKAKQKVTRAPLPGSNIIASSTTANDDIKIPDLNEVRNNKTRYIDEQKQNPDKTNTQERRRNDQATVDEHLYIGNTHSYLGGIKNCHNWSLFLSTDKFKIVPPATVKKVKYYLHSSFGRNKPWIRDKTPFILTKQGWGTFTVRADIEFKTVGNYTRNAIIKCEHDLSFNHELSMTDCNDNTLKYEYIKQIGLANENGDNYTMNDASGYISSICDINYRGECSEIQNKIVSMLNKNRSIDSGKGISGSLEIGGDNFVNEVESEFEKFILKLPKDTELKEMINKIHSNDLTKLPNRYSLVRWFKNNVKDFDDINFQNESDIIPMDAVIIKQEESKDNVDEKKENDTNNDEEENKNAAALPTNPDRKWAMIYLDMDGTKIMNELLSHGVVDDIIIQIGRILQAQISVLKDITDCKLYHIAGDELIVVLRVYNKGECIDFAENLMKLIDQRQSLIKKVIPRSLIDEYGGIVLPITLSAGCALYNDNDTLHDWMRNADHALHSSKRQGKNKINFFGRGRKELVNQQRKTEELFKCITVDEYPVIAVILNLIKNGASLNVYDVNTDNTALMIALKNNKRSVVEQIMHLDFDVNLQDNKGNTVLMMAMILGYDDGIVVPLALKGGKKYNFNLENKDGFNVLDIALQQGYKSVVNIIQSIYSKTDDSQPATSMHLLLNARFASGWFMFIGSKYAEDFLPMNAYLTLGWNVDVFDSVKKRTGLGWAARKVSVECVEFLLNPKRYELDDEEYGIIFSDDEKEEEEKKSENIIKKRKKKIKRMFASINSLSGKTQKNLIKRCWNKKIVAANCNLGDQWGLVPLHNVLYNDNFESNEEKILKIVEMLIKGGADVNRKSLHGNVTPMHYAVSHEHFECIEILLKYGGDLFSINDKNEIPIIDALLKWKYLDASLVHNDKWRELRNEQMKNALIVMVKSKQCTISRLLKKFDNDHNGLYKNRSIIEIIKDAKKQKEYLIPIIKDKLTDLSAITTFN